jgi:uncharacterized protein
MLVDFTVENYRSIREPVTLSAVAIKSKASTQPASKTKRQTKPDHEITPGFYANGWDFSVLPVLAIFGANASGKTNVLSALRDLSLYMWGGSNTVDQSNIGGEAFIFMPFKLGGSKSKATAFSIRFLIEDKMFSYKLSVDRAEVRFEELQYASSSTKRIRRLFSREWNGEEYIWKNGPDFTGPHTQLQKLTRRSEPFFSLATKNLDIEILKPLQGTLIMPLVGLSSGIEEGLAKMIFHRLEGEREKVVDLIKKFDTGLTNIEIRRAAGKEREDSSGEMDSALEVNAVHVNVDGTEIKWPFKEESTGTRRLFEIASLMTLTLGLGRILLIDELGANMHPLLTKEIINLFQDTKINKKGAQLIFTSHDNTLQRNQLLRRDQIWLTEKQAEGNTALYPITDFKIRNDLAIDKAYLDGRFGGVPIIEDLGSDFAHAGNTK